MASTDLSKDQFLKFESLRGYLVPAMELILLAIAAILVAYEYVTPSTQIVPAGREFLSSIQSHHLWNQVKECGTCAFWNGSTRGGFPAFVDPHGSMLHPLVGISTLLWGVINGTKFTLIASLWFAGLAQWWMAKVLKVGWVPRIWSSLVVVFGGHLAGRMELGAFGVVLSTAMCSLFFPALLSVFLRKGRIWVFLLAIVSASALLSGQGYMQMGIAASLPAILVLFVNEDPQQSKSNLQRLTIAAGLTLLMVAPFLLPFLKFSPNFVKAVDPDFTIAQPLEYAVLNLVIRDQAFYWSSVLEKAPFPHLYTLFIGWIPVIFAVLALFFTKPQDRRIIYYLVIAALLIFLAAGGPLLRLGAEIIPFLAGFRHSPQIASMAIPLIIGLAAYGLDRVLSLEWPVIRINHPSLKVENVIGLSLKWLLLIGLAVNLHNAYSFSRPWYYSRIVHNNVYRLLDGLVTEDLQWVSPPFGEHDYIEPAIAKGLKVSPGILPWYFRERELPPPQLAAMRMGTPNDSAEQIDTIDQIPIYRMVEENYVFIETEQGRIPCSASGRGGSITVRCDSPKGGRLVVRENAFSGWRATEGGNSVRLLGDRWLEIEASAGEQTYHFRYVPWDAYIGIILAIVGFAGGLLYVWRGNSQQGRKL